MAKIARADRAVRAPLSTVGGASAAAVYEHTRHDVTGSESGRIRDGTGSRSHAEETSDTGCQGARGDEVPAASFGPDDASPMEVSHPTTEGIQHDESGTSVSVTFKDQRTFSPPADAAAGEKETEAIDAGVTSREKNATCADNNYRKDAASPPSTVVREEDKARFNVGRATQVAATATVITPAPIDGDTNESSTPTAERTRGGEVSEEKQITEHSAPHRSSLLRKKDNDRQENSVEAQRGKNQQKQENTSVEGGRKDDSDFLPSDVAFNDAILSHRSRVRVVIFSRPHTHRSRSKRNGGSDGEGESIPGPGEYDIGRGIDQGGPAVATPSFAPTRYGQGILRLASMKAFHVIYDRRRQRRSSSEPLEGMVAIGDDSCVQRTWSAFDIVSMFLSYCHPDLRHSTGHVVTSPGAQRFITGGPRDRGLT